MYLVNLIIEIYVSLMYLLLFFLSFKLTINKLLFLIESVLTLTKFLLKYYRLDNSCCPKSICRSLNSFSSKISSASV